MQKLKAMSIIFIFKNYFFSKCRAVDMNFNLCSLISWEVRCFSPKAPVRKLDRQACFHCTGTCNCKCKGPLNRAIQSCHFGEPKGQHGLNNA